MRPKSRTKVSGAGGWMALVLLGLAVPDFSVASVSQSQALINQYCAVCHNQTLKSGGISLAEIDLSDIARNSGTLEKVLRKVH